MSPPRLPLPALATLLALAALPARADTLVTLDGRLLQGTVRLDPSGTFVVSNSAGPIARVELSQLLAFRDQNASAAFLRRGVVLTSGSALAIDRLLKSDPRTLRVARPAPAEPLDLPLASVATLVFAGSPSLRFPAHDTPGALLTSGDFFEGDLLSASDQRLVVGSTLFGDRTFDPGKDLVAVRLRAAALPVAPFVVRLTDGTVARASALKSADDRLTFDDPAFGPLSATRFDIAEILAAPGDRLAPLFDTSVAPASGVAPALRGPPAPWPVPASPLPSVAMPAGTDRTIELAGRASAVFLRVGVPAALLPARSIRFVALLDGDIVYRSPPLTSVDDAVLIALSTDGRQRLTLRVESDMPTPSEGLWSDALLVRAR